MSETLKVGDKLTHFGGGTAFISAINKGLLKYEVTIEGKNGQRTENYTTKEFNKYFEICSQSPNSTSAQELVLGSPLLEFNSTQSSSLDSVNKTNGATQSSNLDTPPFQSRQKCETWNACDKSGKKRKSSQQRPLANRSQSKEKGQAEPTIEIVSPPSSEQSQAYNQSILQLKMSPDYYLAHTDQVWGVAPISGILFGSYTNAGTMSNGKPLAVESLPAHSLGKDYYWLASPGALSSKSSRAPGLSRLESQLKKLNLLKSGECINPAFLENAFEIPPGWSDPSELRSAVELQGLGAKPLEIASIQELPISQFRGSCTSTHSSNQVGSLYQYTSQKKGMCYPKILGERQREEDKHWYWGYSYVEKSCGRWHDKSASVPQKKLSAVRTALRDRRNYQYILQNILGKD